MYKPDTPYNELPLLPPAVEMESKEVLKKSISATAKLAELKGMGNQIPNQSVLLSGLGLQEAKLSSEIENIVTTNDEIFKALSEIEGHYDSATKEVLRYRDALWKGFHLMKERKLLTTNLFIELAATIKQQENFSVRQLPGTKIMNSRRETIYTPPEGEDVIRSKLLNLEKFIHNEDGLDALVKMAVVHYQFEAIHPFYDGNGRTGRIINILFLVLNDLLDLPVLYLSRYIIQNKNQYYTLLRSVTEESNWKEWIMFMLDAVEQTAGSAIQKIHRLKDLLAETQREIQEKAPRIYSKDLVEALFIQPYCRIQFLEQAGLGHRQTVANYLKKLDEIGVVHGVKTGREVYYINKRMVEWIVD